MNKKFDRIVQGQLVVVGNNHAVISLRGRPHLVEVEFIDQEKHHPCHPHHHDLLEWKIDFRKNRFVLIIDWHVANTRTIAYTIDFSGR